MLFSIVFMIDDYVIIIVISYCYRCKIYLCIYKYKVFFLKLVEDVCGFLDFWILVDKFLLFSDM